MRGAFEDEELEPVTAGRDKELTLGSGSLLAIGLGLLVLCVVCFGLGYAIGNRGRVAAAAALPAPSQPIGAGNPIAKPPATAQAADASQSLDSEDSGQPQSGAAPATNDGSGTQAAPASGSAGAEAGQPAVHPALASISNQSPQAVQVPAGSPATGSWMVQIAAVSNVEDAQVLADALRKRGYAVVAHRDPGDNLIHVRIGPFATAVEANSWRMKLLNDGYNAVVQQ
jgi:cell division septation protein DedD